VQNLTGKLVFSLYLDHADQVNQPNHDYSNHVRQQVYQALLMRSKNGKLGKHDTTIVGDQFGVKIRTVQRIWQQGKNQLVQNIPVKVPNLKKGRSGRKAIPLDLENLRNIPLQQRMTIEDVHKPIFIQQDNAPSHLKVNDPQFCEVAKQDGFDIRLICQPPNSPDFNILDLGFFRAIQAIQYKKNAKTMQELIPAVEEVNDHPFDCFNTIKILRK